MKTFTWQAICIVGALAALVSFPGISSAAHDCTFGGAISPALPTDGDECVASGAVTAIGVLEVDTASTSEFDIEGGAVLRIKRPGHGSSVPGSLIVDDSAIVDGGCDVDDPPNDVFQPVSIDAADDIDNDGTLTICNSRQGVSLRAANGDIDLDGDDTYLEGSQVKLSSDKGDISLDGATIVSDKGTVDVVAPHGTITATNSTFSAQDGKKACRFTGTFVNGGGNDFTGCSAVVVIPSP
jgi:hypothetical protein